MDDTICIVFPQSDTFYYDQSMHVEESDKFREAMVREFKTHSNANIGRSLR